MAEIISQEAVADGYEIVVRLIDGRVRRWHFLSEPADKQKVVDEAEIRLKCGEIEEWERGN